RQGLNLGLTVVQLDPSLFVALPKTMVDTSARGPRINDSRIKPEITAPGASVSAWVGSGAHSKPFGGTSGAAPVVAGAAALLKELYGNTLEPFQYRALLMNSADSAISMVEPLTGQQGDLAPISRMGSGQVDVAASHQTRVIAWDSTEDDPLTWTGALSFGYQAVTRTTVITRMLTLQNLHNTPVQATLGATFRYANDENAGVQIAPQPNVVNLSAAGSQGDSQE